MQADGRLTRALKGYVPREQQLSLASLISEAIEDKTVLVAEAGTGTGKTFAYLLPGLVSGKKMLISTATKTLQDQLFNKDLPMLVKALGLSIRVQNLKGRANYICRYRVVLHAEEGQFQTPQAAHEILLIREKLGQLKNGERSELPEIKEDSPVWPYVTSTADNCLGQECPEHQHCFLLKARRRALEANVVVINHHLFFADALLKESGLGELLPGVEVVILDEAHQLNEIATHFYADRISTRQWRDLVDDMLKEWPVLDLPNQPLKALSLKMDVLIDALLLHASMKEERMPWDALCNQSAFMQVWSEWMALKDAFLKCLEDPNVAEIAGLTQCKNRLLEYEKIMALFTNSKSENICWVEKFKQTLVFHATPYDIANTFSSLLKLDHSAYIFTSATLTLGSSFDCFTKPLGLLNTNQVLLPSPFNYQEQALLYLPRSLPDPKNPEYYPKLLARVLPIIDACGGRCFFLFTSHRALKEVAQLLSNTLKYPLLIQGDEAKPILLEKFREYGNAVLLGTSTFWEGVDVKGEALSCVIIDKLPFASPGDPVVRGKMDYLESQGISSFDAYSLPNAVIALKQGVGRLIRDFQDKGVLVLADPRITAREYGRVVLSSLPNLPKTRDEQTVLNFIKNNISKKDEDAPCL